MGVLELRFGQRSQNGTVSDIIMRMINFIVTTRGKDGFIEERSYSAENRTVLFKKLNTEGVSVVRVREASEKEALSKSMRGVSPRFSRLAVFGGLAIAIASIAFFLLQNKTVDSESLPAKKIIKKQQKATPVSVKADRVSSNKTVEVSVKDSKSVDAQPPHKKIVEMISVITNADGSVLERFRTADGKIRSRQSAPRSVFENSTDQLIAMAIQGATSPGGMPPMPMSSNVEEDFLRSLNKPIVINPDDSEDVKRLKQQVMEVRADIDQLMKEGRTFADIMREHQSLVNDNASIRKDVMSGLHEYVDKGDMEGAQEYLNKMNAALKQMGMESIEMPESPEERRQRIREESRIRKEMQK